MTELRPFLTGDGRVVSVQFFNRAGEAFSIDAGSVALRLSPADRPGAAIRVAASAIGAQPASMVRGGGSRVTLSFALPPSTPSGLYDVAFDDARDAGLSFLEADVPKIYVSSAAEPGDPGLAAARRELLGTSVYVGAMPSEFDCTARRGASVSAGRGTPLRVLSVRRVRAAETGYLIDGPDADFLALEPLEIAFAPVPSRDVSGSAASMSPGQTFPFPLSSCGTYVIALADPWEVQRRFPMRSPFDHPQWPAAFLDAVKRGDVIAGMTHEMVANTIGYPSAYGSIAALDRLARWDYPVPVPFSSTVYFKGDRVVRYDPPGNLP